MSKEVSNLRRRLLTLTCLTVVTVGLANPRPSWSATQPVGSIDWSQFGFDQANTDHNPFETVLDPSNVGQTHRIWTAKLGEAMIGAPALVGGVVYACTWQASPTLHALDSSNGSELWTANHACSSPAVADGVVVANDGTQLHGVDSVTGADLWVVNMVMNGGGTPAPPRIVDGVVYVGDTDGDFNALDVATGQARWKARTNGAIFDAAAVGNGRIYVESDDGRIYAFDQATGARVWALDMGAGSSAGPVFDQGVVYASAYFSEQLVALDASTGAALWTVDLGCHPGQPSLASGVLYVPLQCKRGGVAAYEASSGALIWAVSFKRETELPSPVAVANGVLYLCLTRTLGMLEAATGLELASADLGPGQIPPTIPIVLNGRIYVGSTVGRNELYAAGL